MRIVSIACLVLLGWSLVLPAWSLAAFALAASALAAGPTSASRCIAVAGSFARQKWCRSH